MPFLVHHNHPDAVDNALFADRAAAHAYARGVMARRRTRAVRVVDIPEGQPFSFGVLWLAGDDVDDPPDVPDTDDDGPGASPSSSSSSWSHASGPPSAGSCTGPARGAAAP